MRQMYIAWNGAVPTTGAQVATTLTNAQKTQLQVTAASTGQLELIAWGFSMNGSATPAVDLGVQVELLTTGTVAGGTPTAVTPSLYGDPNAPASTTTAGFAPATEGTISAVRTLDSEFMQKIGGYTYQFPQDKGPIVAVSQVVRIRTNTPALAAFPTFLCYLVWAE